MWRSVAVIMAVACAALLAVLFAGVAGSDALAQAGPPVQPGQRVRVQSTVPHTLALVGTVEAIGPDTLVVRYEGEAGAGGPTTIPLAGIARLQVSSGQRSRWLSGMLWGLGIGAAAGALLGVGQEGCGFGLSETSCSATGAVAFGAIGAGIGTVIGLLKKTEKWETVPLDRVGPSVGRSPDGRLTLGARVAF